MKLLLVAVAAVAWSGFASAQPVQKWVDEKGRVHYGTPPHGAVKQQAMTGGTVSAPGAGKSTAPARKVAKPRPAAGTGTTAAPGGGPFSEQARKDFSREIEGSMKDGDTRHPFRK